MSTRGEDDILALIEDDGPGAALATEGWRVLIVDDDADVHQSTEFALANTPILGRPLSFLHAYSAAEAHRLLAGSTDIAVILLDVVMEREDSGLQLVRVIREELGLQEARIILRTGQPGYAPELDAIRDYDINDYKTKSELSRNRLYASLTAAIRGYEQIHAINASRRGLDMIVRASGRLTAAHGAREFAAGVIVQIAALLGLEPEGVVCVQDSDHAPGETRVIAAAGHYTDGIDRPLGELACEETTAALADALAQRRNIFSADATTLYFAGESGHRMAAYIRTKLPLTDTDRHLLEVFCTNITVNLDNVVLFARLSEHAYLDQLLRIPNRVALVAEIDRARQADTAGAAVALVDIDDFSQLNDALGHAYGDTLLRAVAGRLREMLPESRMIARVAADVFGILAAEAALEAGVLREIFRKPFLLDDAEHTVSASVGIARLDEVSGGDGTEVLKAASIALGRAKEGNRGDLCHFSAAMEFETRSRVHLLRELRNAFDRDRLFIAYQPQVSLADRKIVGLEALLRWRREDGVFVAPDQFIPLAESSGLIVALGEWVLRTACVQQRRLAALGHDLRMAVNVSVAQFRSPRFLAAIDAAIAESGIAPAQLELEITESVAMLDADFMLDMVARIKQRGITVAVDDFGTGFSSLSYLERLHVDRLKIDRSFINQMSTAASSERVVETIVQLGRNLGLVVIAEGVEREDEVATLRQMGCQEGQGYLFAKPLAADLLVTLLAAP